MINLLKRFWYEEEGMGVVEIALIIIVIVGVVIIFKDQLTTIIETLMDRISGDITDV